MPGLGNIVSGLVLLGASATGLYLYDFGDSLLVYVVWGAAALGGIMILGGIRQMMDYETGAADATEAYHEDTITRLVMQSTITTALADGHLDDEEVDMIVTACEAVLHEHLDKESIPRLAKMIEERGDSIMAEIHSEALMLNVEARRAVIEACIMVLTADKKVDERETSAVTAIARHMNFSEEETQEMIEAALKELEQD